MRCYVRTALVAMAAGLVYTAFSERRNAVMLGTWSYSELMPVIPGLSIGPSPMLQWLIIPAVAFGWSFRGS